MKRLAVAALFAGLLLMALTHPTRAQEQKKTEASLDEALQLLGEKLEQSGTVRISYGIASPGRQTYQRTIYLGREGCTFRYRLRHQEINSSAGFEKSGFNASDWSVNLAKVDPDSIEVVTKPEWTGGFVNFRIADGERGVKCHNCSGPNPNTYATGGFAIGDKNSLEAIAASLRQAVCLCRE